MKSDYFNRLIEENYSIEKLNISPEECKRTIEALRQVQVASISDKVLDYLISSTSIKNFLLNEQNEISKLLGKSNYRSRVVKGGFGAGKTHIKKDISEWIRNNYGPRAMIISFKLPTQYNNYDFFEELALFRYEDRYQFYDFYKKLYEIYYEQEKSKRKKFIEEIIDEIFQNKFIFEKVENRLVNNGIDKDLAAIIVSCFCGEEEMFSEKELKEAICDNSRKDGQVFFNSWFHLLNDIGVECLCVFIDDFQNLELESWKPYWDGFGNLLAEFHESFSCQFEKDEGVSLYILTFVQSRFWDGTFGQNGLPNLEKLKQHWDTSHEFSISEFNREEDLIELIIKIIALYKKSGTNIPKELLERIIQEDEITKNIRKKDPNAPFVPRSIIKEVINIVDNSVLD